MKPSVSIVVPVYNVEAYLQRCLDSLTGQTLQNIEIIVVDDGSTDASNAIATACAERDTRIKVIRQENRGVSGARNAGLDAASGEYVGFADPDDWTEPKEFEMMYHQAWQDDSDLCACDYSLAFEHKTEPNVLGLATEKLEIRKYGLDRLWNEKKYSVVVWNKLYRRDILETYKVRFESTRNVFSEDALFNLFFLYHASTASSVEGSYYNYYQQRNNSLMNSYKPDHLRRELFLVDRFADYYAAFEQRDVYERILLRLFFERVQNSCLHSVETLRGVGGTWRELREASKHHLFADSMEKASSDKEIWIIMRLFARLSAARLLLPASLYMHTFGTLQRMKNRLASKRNSKSAKSIESIESAEPAESAEPVKAQSA